MAHSDLAGGLQTKLQRMRYLDFKPNLTPIVQYLMLDPPCLVTAYFFQTPRPRFGGLLLKKPNRLFWDIVLICLRQHFSYCVSAHSVKNKKIQLIKLI